MAEKTIAILKTDGTHEFVKHDKNNSLEAMQAGVGGYIETVFVPHFKGQVYANEEGMMIGLPSNAWSNRIGYPGLVGNLVVAFSGRDVTEADIANLTPQTPAARERMATITRGIW